MKWTIRTDREFDRALKKLDRQVATRVLKAFTALEHLADPRNDAKPYRVPTPVYGDCEWTTTA